MSNQIPPPYPEEQRWYGQPGTGYPDRDSYGRPVQPQAGYQGQTPASPYPGNEQGMYPQQQGFAGNNPYAGNGSLYASNNLYAAPQPMYQPPASPYAPPPVPSVYASPYIQGPYGMVDSHAGKATAGLVFGIITAVLGLTGWLSVFILRGFALLGFIPFFVCGILGIVFSAQGRRSTTKRGTGTTGLVLSLVGLGIGILIFVVFLIIGLAILNSQTQ